jgi:hypothetical protein
MKEIEDQIESDMSAGSNAKFWDVGNGDNNSSVNRILDPINQDWL